MTWLENRLSYCRGCCSTALCSLMLLLYTAAPASLTRWLPRCLVSRSSLELHCLTAWQQLPPQETVCYDGTSGYGAHLEYLIAVLDVECTCSFVLFFQKNVCCCLISNSNPLMHAVHELLWARRDWSSENAFDVLTQRSDKETTSSCSSTPFLFTRT